MAKHELDDLVEDTLQHYGIKGMSWGVRRSDAEIAAANAEGGGGGGGDEEGEDEDGDGILDSMEELFDEALDSTMDKLGDFAKAGLGMFNNLFGSKVPERSKRMEAEFKRQMAKQRETGNKAKDMAKPRTLAQRLKDSVKSGLMKTTKGWDISGVKRNRKLENKVKNQMRANRVKEKQGFKPKAIPKAPSRLDKLKTKVDKAIYTPKELNSDLNRGLKTIDRAPARMDREREGRRKRELSRSHRAGQKKAYEREKKVRNQPSAKVLKTRNQQRRNSIKIGQGFKPNKPRSS